MAWRRAATAGGLRRGGAASASILELADPDSANRNPVRCNLALVHMRQHKYRVAAEVLAELLDDPRYVQAYFQMGQCLSRLQRPDVAEAFTSHSRSLPAMSESNVAISSCEAPGSRYWQPALAVCQDDSRETSPARRTNCAEPVEDSSNLQLRVYLADHYVECHQIQRASREIDVLASRLTEEHPDVRGWRATCLAAERPAEAAEIPRTSACAMRRCRHGDSNWHAFSWSNCASQPERKRPSNASCNKGHIRRRQSCSAGMYEQGEWVQAA